MYVTILVLSVILYIVSGVLSYGAIFGYFQNKYSRIAKDVYKEDRYNALIISLLGPIGLLVIYTSPDGVKYGFKWW